MSLYQSPLYSIPSTRSMTASFGGLNRRPVIADGEFFDMQNLTSDDAPLLSVRPQRGIPFPHTKQDKPVAIAVRGAGGLGVDQAVWLDGTVLHYGLSWTLDLAEYGMTDDGTERRLVAMGAYIIVFPDMIYVNAVETAERAVAPTDVGRIEDEYVNTSNRFRLEVCDYEGKTPEEMRDILAERIAAAKIPSMVVTMGEQGAVYADSQGNSGCCPARRVHVKDTTGAGDAFCAGVSIGLTYGKTMREACEIGSMLAASVIVTAESVCPRFLPRELGLDMDVVD